MNVAEAVAFVGPAPKDRALLELYYQEFDARASLRFRKEASTPNSKVLALFEDMAVWFELVAVRAGRTQEDAHKLRQKAARQVCDRLRAIGRQAKRQQKRDGFKITIFNKEGTK